MSDGGQQRRLKIKNEHGQLLRTTETVNKNSWKNSNPINTVVSAGIDPKELENLIAKFKKTLNMSSSRLDLTAHNLKNLSSDKVNQLIKHSKLNSCKVDDLYLTRNHLSVPLNVDLNQFKNLKRLFLNENSLTIFPEEIFDQRDLWYLDVRANKIKDIPENIYFWVGIYIFSLENSRLPIIRYNIFNIFWPTQLFAIKTTTTTE